MLSWHPSSKSKLSSSKQIQLSLRAKIMELWKCLNQYFNNLFYRTPQPSRSRNYLLTLSIMTGPQITRLQCLKCSFTVWKSLLTQKARQLGERDSWQTPKVTVSRWLRTRKGPSFSCSLLNFTSLFLVCKRSKCCRCTKMPSRRIRLPAF